MDLQTLLASGDVDAMRLMLSRGTPAPEAFSHTEGDADRGDDDPLGRILNAAGIRSDPLRGTAIKLADSILARGIVHLEAEAKEREEAATAEVATRPLIELPHLGLKLLAHPVMGEPVWPAARALSCWLMTPERRSRCFGARVIELGAGCAAPALVADASGGASFVALTDVDPEVVSLMQANAELNCVPSEACAVGSCSLP